MKYFNRHSSHGHQMAQALWTGATHSHTLTWIPRIHLQLHTYINTVTTTLCEAPAQLLTNLESIVFLLKVGKACNAVATWKFNNDMVHADLIQSKLLPLTQ